MATYYNPRIITSGLVVCLDAANTKSYPGSGTTWSDLSGNGNAGTLTNGPTFSSANRGAIIFDGVNDYADIPLPLSAGYSTITIEGFIKWNSFNDGMFLGFTNYDVWTLGNALGYNANGSYPIGIDASTVTSLGLLGNYKHYAFVMNSSGLLSTNKIYINGVSQFMSTAVPGGDKSIPGFSTTLSLATWNDRNYYASMQYANVKVYNKELTSIEIAQNFNAYRSRFGI
jgi:hypothetical protein